MVGSSGSDPELGIQDPESDNRCRLWRGLPVFPSQNLSKSYQDLFDSMPIANGQTKQLTQFCGFWPD